MDTEQERWTRKHVAEHLDVSVATVRRLEDAGELVPEIGPRNVRLYDPSAVKAYASGNDAGEGPTASTSSTESDDETPYPDIFELLNQGSSPVEIVRKLKLHPQASAAALS